MYLNIHLISFNVMVKCHFRHENLHHGEKPTFSGIIADAILQYFSNVNWHGHEQEVGDQCQDTLPHEWLLSWSYTEDY